MTDPHVVLRSLGEVAHIRTLRRHGVADADLRAQVRSGRLRRLRIGWYASRFADADQIAAVSLGGRLGCVTALGRMGVWSGADAALHVHFEPNRSGPPQVPDASRESSAPAVAHPRTLDDRRVVARLSDPRVPPRSHWRPEPEPDAALDWVVLPAGALAEALRCQPVEHAQAVVDTIVGAGMLTRGQVQRIVEGAPDRVGIVVDELSGCVGSGAESFGLRRLRAAGHEVRPQFQLAGHGRFDSLVDGCVLFEVDGWEFHRTREQFILDRERTLIAQSFGLPVVRAAATKVMRDWPTVLDAVERAVSDARALGRHR
ncbi:hypothetical protein ACGGZK_17560 [Agromyces sp. MMS24-K17]|uniref:hypothetical protein n=1 Tax=Agromyces sp. MMS24-K17 TaxID=3372850 RepID=UPI0037540218